MSLTCKEGVCRWWRESLAWGARIDVVAAQSLVLCGPSFPRGGVVGVMVMVILRGKKTTDA